MIRERSHLIAAKALSRTRGGTLALGRGLDGRGSGRALGTGNAHNDGTTADAVLLALGSRRSVPTNSGLVECETPPQPLQATIYAAVHSD